MRLLEATERIETEIAEAYRMLIHSFGIASKKARSSAWLRLLAFLPSFQ
jgi:hypothetical protein